MPARAVTAAPRSAEPRASRRRIDPANCGACGTKCPTGEVCSIGNCGVTCLGGSALCGTTCVETQNDPANCGACGTACPTGQVCSTGKCGVTCLGGSTLCGTTCVDTTDDPANCGACGTACPSGPGLLERQVRRDLPRWLHALRRHLRRRPGAIRTTAASCGNACPGRKRRGATRGLLGGSVRRDLPRRLDALRARRRRRLLRRDRERSEQLRSRAATCARPARSARPASAA